MELPLYHAPNPRTLGRFVWDNTFSFLRKAGGIILAVSVAVWALAYFPNGDVQTSYLAGLGRWLEPVGALLGIGDWRILTALFSSFLAKENTVATLGVLFGEGDLASSVAAAISPAGAAAFLVIQMLFIPCAATAAAIHQEAGGKWMWISLGLQLAISLIIGVAVYHAVLLAGG
jgi:ferrous iron transport protein B